MARVVTAGGSGGRSYVRRAMTEPAQRGLAETNGKDGRHPVRHLTVAGRKALADGNELPRRPRAVTGARAVRAGFGPHGTCSTAADVRGITIAVWVNTLPRLQQGEPWYAIGTDDPERRRLRSPEPSGR